MRSLKEMVFGAIVSTVTLLTAVGAPGQGITVGPESWAMSPEETIAYQRNVVLPLLVGALNDPPALPPGIARRVRELFFQEIDWKRIIPEVAPYYHPLSRTILSDMVYDPDVQKPVLFIFVPALRDKEREFRRQGRTDMDLQLFLALTFAHIQVHLGLDTKYPNIEIEPREEAEAWAIILLEMIRPALAQRRWLPDYFRYDSDGFRKARDYDAHPVWPENFRSPLTR